MKLIKILAISSSPNEGGHTEKLLERFIRAAKSYGAKITKINLYQYKIKASTCKLGEKIKKLTKLQKLMVETDGFVIATPTYWFNVPGVLKNFIDHLTILEENGFLLEGKVGGFIVYAPEGGEMPVLENLAVVFNHMGVILPPYCLIFYRGTRDRWAIDDLKLLAKNMILQIKAQKSYNINWDYE